VNGLLAVAAVLAALAFIAWALWPRAALPEGAPRRAGRLRHPVVLAHGVLGFDEIAVAGRRHSYFRNIEAALRRVGAECHHPRVPALGPVEDRAARLAELVGSVPGGRVNVIAHSMGGLDARYAIARLGLSARVASLVTIGTPHFGTPLADLASKGLPRSVARAVGDLTTDALDRFNRDVPDAPGVLYCSVAARSALTATNPLLWPTHAFLSHRSGPNDGLVPTSSQRWGRVLREIDADHWAQIGWSRRFDAAALYEEILRELAGFGF
jgi:triacylglycerol lipase